MNLKVPSSSNLRSYGWVECLAKPFPDCSQPPASLSSCALVCGTSWVGAIFKFHREEQRSEGPRAAQQSSHSHPGLKATA